MQDQEGTPGAHRRRIAVMRHGKAEQSGPTDFERELADRGHADSEDVGAWLAQQGFVPDLAIVSAAHRTIATWGSVASGGGFDLEPELSEALYGAGPETVLDLLRETPSDAVAVLVVGHNPTIAYLASLLDDGDGDPAVSAEMMGGFPTSAVALFEHEGEWADLSEAGARLVAFHVGRG